MKLRRAFRDFEHHAGLLVAAGILAACGSGPSSPPLATSAATRPTVPPVATGPTLTYADAVAFWDGQRGIAGLSLDRPDGSSSGQLVTTSDAGHTWRTLGFTPAGVVQVAVAGSANAWALAGCSVNRGCEARLYRSTNDGMTWTSAPTDLSSISFADSRDGWGVAGGWPPADPSLPALRRTHDGGATWATVPTPCAGSTVGPLRTASARTATAGLAVCALTAGAGGELHGVFATNDGGAHWAVRASTSGVSSAKPIGSLPYGGYITGLVEALDGTAWITGGRMVPLASRDGGATWQPLALGDPAANLVEAAWPLDATRGFAVMWAPDSQASLLEATTDGGRRWSVRSSWSVTTTDGSMSASP